jgi:hypothetical protein
MQAQPGIRIGLPELLPEFQCLQEIDGAAKAQLGNDKGAGWGVFLQGLFGLLPA